MGATAAAVTTIVIHRSARAIGHSDSEVVVRTDAQLWKMIMPSKVSVGVAAVTVTATTIHLCFTSMRHLSTALFGIGISIGAGHVVNSIASDTTVRIPLPGRWWREEKVGTVVRNGGLSLTGMWLTSRMAQELFCFSIITGIGLLPMVEDVAETVHRNRNMLLASVSRRVHSIQRYADHFAPQYQVALNTLWEQNFMNRTSIQAGECSNLLFAFMQQRAHEAQFVVSRNVEAVGANNGTAQVFGMLAGGGLTFMTNQFVLAPWANSNRDRNVTKEEYLALYDRCVVDVLGGMATTIATLQR